MIRVLHVDDNDNDQMLTKIRLEQLSETLVAVDSVGSGPEALRRLESSDYNCIISDFRMPGMDGLQLLHTLRERGNNTPFILLTNQDSEELEDGARKAGVDAYHTKDGKSAHYEQLLGSIVSLTKKKGEDPPDNK